MWACTHKNRHFPSKDTTRILGSTFMSIVSLLISLADAPTIHTDDFCYHCRNIFYVFQCVCLSNETLSRKPCFPVSGDWLFWNCFICFSNEQPRNSFNFLQYVLFQTNCTRKIKISVSLGTVLLFWKMCYLKQTIHGKEKTP